MYGSWQIRWRHIFDVRFVLALMYNSYSLDFDYMNKMMSFEVLGYRLEWTKKLMLPVPYMNSWSLYVVDVEEKTLLVMDLCETSKAEEVMKLKHEDNANIVLEGLRRCIHANIAGWYVPSQGWRVLYNVGIPAAKSRTATYMWRITSGSSRGCTSTFLSHRTASTTSAG